MSQIKEALAVIREEVARLADGGESNFVAVWEMIDSVQDSLREELAKKVWWGYEGDEAIFIELNRSVEIRDAYFLSRQKGLGRFRHEGYLDNPDEVEATLYGCTPQEFAAVLSKKARSALKKRRRLAEDFERTKIAVEAIEVR